MLSDSEASDAESFHQLTINEHYAKAFEYKKEREELQKLKEKYGSDYEEDAIDELDSESDESEDEDGEELTPTVDAAILRTLARIKRRDPDIYNPSKNIFGEEQHKVTTVKKSVKVPKNKSKPVTIRQVALETALHPDERSPSPEILPHVEEQRVLRDETIAAFQHAVGESDDEDALFIPREKTRDEQEKEEEDYRSFLEREVGDDLRELVFDLNDGNAATDKSDKKKKKEKKEKKDSQASKAVAPGSVEESNQEFLLNYILNRGWIDRSANRIPTYNEITASKSKGKKRVEREVSTAASGPEDDADAPNSDLDDEDFDEIADRFESSYNFRFEEPDAAVIPTHPRNVPSLVRREDTRRKEARERRKKRKDEEIQKRKEEVKRLKNLKMKDIRAKLERIGREGGKKVEENEALQKLDLDGDWDPDAHDRQMAEIYDGDDDLNEDEKPYWDEDIDIGDIHPEATTKDKKKKKKKKKRDAEEETNTGVDIDAMDADVDGLGDDEEWDGTEEMRKRKLDEYMEEVYGLEFNDLVGDQPTRFRYVPIPSEDFALTAAEILMATDQELNEYMGIKRYAPYRKQGSWDSKRKDKLKVFKERLAERMKNGSFNSGDPMDSGKSIKKRKGKKERLRSKISQGENTNVADS